jgi:hypothetical protein
VRLGGSSFFQRHEGVGRQPPGGVAQHMRGRRNGSILADWNMARKSLEPGRKGHFRPGAAAGRLAACVALRS